LFGERARILDLAPGYYKVRLDTDGYEGWIRQNTAAGYDCTPNARIAMASVHVTSEQDVKSPALLRLSLGSLVRVEASNADWQQIHLSAGRTGFIPSIACCDTGHCADDYVSAAEKLVGAPYLWGGRSAAGIDCSALVQLSLQTAGIACPRDSGPQRQWARKQGKSVRIGEETQRGDLLFWPGHVAICQSATHILHANAHHHAVTSEPISLALPRLAKATGCEAEIFRLSDG
jgi:cell wall-associated NlpC family hydrolase